MENFQHSSDLAPHILQAGHELGIKTVDYNGKEQLGLGVPQVTGKSGKRNSVAQAYLVPAHVRKNLVVRPLSHVVEVIITPHTKEAQGVKYIHDGKIFVVKAAKEVVLAAGPINTPQLLLLSGKRTKMRENSYKLLLSLRHWTQRRPGTPRNPAGGRFESRTRSQGPPRLHRTQLCL